MLQFTYAHDSRHVQMAVASVVVLHAMALTALWAQKTTTDHNEKSMTMEWVLAPVREQPTPPKQQKQSVVTPQATSKATSATSSATTSVATAKATQSNATPTTPDAQTPTEPTPAPGGATPAPSSFSNERARTAPALTLPSSEAQGLNNPKPAYPKLSRRLNEQGQVVIRVYVGVDGNAQQGDIKTSSGYDRLDQEALRVVLRWRFVPGQRLGVPEAMWFNVPVNFVLE